MTVEEVRNILGDIADNYTDDEVYEIISSLRGFVHTVLDNAERKHRKANTELQ